MHSVAFITALSALLPWTSALPALDARDQVTFLIKDFNLNHDSGYDFTISSNRAPGNTFKCTGTPNKPNTQRLFKTCEGDGPQGYQALIESIPGDRHFLRILYTQRSGDYLEGKLEVQWSNKSNENKDFSFNPYTPSYEFDISDFFFRSDSSGIWYRFEVTRHGEPKRGLICHNHIPNGNSQLGFSDCKAKHADPNFVSHFKSSIRVEDGRDNLIIRWYNSDTDYTEGTLEVNGGTQSVFTLPNLYW